MLHLKCIPTDLNFTILCCSYDCLVRGGDCDDSNSNNCGVDRWLLMLFVLFTLAAFAGFAAPSPGGTCSCSLLSTQMLVDLDDCCTV